MDIYIKVLPLSKPAKGFVKPLFECVVCDIDLSCVPYSELVKSFDYIFVNVPHIVTFEFYPKVPNFSN